MHLQDLVAQMGQRLDGIDRVYLDEAALIDVLCHGEPGFIQGVLGIVAHVKTHAGIQTRAALLVEFLKLIEPLGATRSVADADFEQIHLGGQLVLGSKNAEQVQEFGDVVGDRAGIVAVGRAAGERFVVPLAGSGFPGQQMTPEESVEGPDDAGAQGLELFERETAGILLRSGLGTMNRAEQIATQGFGDHLARVDVHVHDGGGLAESVVALGGGDGFAKIGFVLDPIEFHLETRELTLIDEPFFHQRVDGLDHALRGGGGLHLEVVKFQDHAD